MNVKNTTLIERYAAHPARAEIVSALSAAERFAERSTAIRGNKDLSEHGRSKEITSQLRSALRDVRDAGLPINAMKTKLATLVASIKPVSFAKDDLAGALLRQDLRGLLRNMTLGEKAAVLLGEHFVSEFVDSALEGPAALSGLDSQMYEQVREQRLESLYSKESAEVEALSDTIADGEAGLEIARGDLSRAAGLPEWEFTKLVDEVNSKRDGPWLKREMLNGKERIVVVLPGQSDYPTATASQIREGTFHADHAAWLAARAA
jgi:hypothetical protein